MDIHQLVPERIWQKFSNTYEVSEQQLEQFARYATLLHEWNQRINLTAVDSGAGIVSRHFADSLMFARFRDMKTIKVIADVGTGAGFPAIPLKIMYPHLGVILIEVSRKKQQFLQTVIEALDLKDIEICSYDWRTFLRTTVGEVDYFFARASLDVGELARMFKPACAYNKATLVYWAAKEWEPDKKVAPFVREVQTYKLKGAERKLIFLGLPTDD